MRSHARESASSSERAFWPWRTPEHRCSKACYLCLKHYRNQHLHAQLDKERVREALLSLSLLDPEAPKQVEQGAHLEALRKMLAARATEATTGGQLDTATGRYGKGFIEEPLLEALRRYPRVPAPLRDHEVRNENGALMTVPDFAWPDARLAVFCDGYAYHGDPETLELDARKRNWMQAQGWAVLVYWGRTILKDPRACAVDIAGVYASRVGLGQ